VDKSITISLERDDAGYPIPKKKRASFFFIIEQKGEGVGGVTLRSSSPVVITGGRGRKVESKAEGNVPSTMNLTGEVKE